MNKKKSQLNKATYSLLINKTKSNVYKKMLTSKRNMNPTMRESKNTLSFRLNPAKSENWSKSKAGSECVFFSPAKEEGAGLKPVGEHIFFLQYL